MPQDSDTPSTGSIIRDPKNYGRPDFLADEKIRFAIVETAVLGNNAAELASLIEALKPPVEYLQYEMFRAICGKHLATVRCLLQSGAELDPTICWHACFRNTISIEMIELLFEHGWDVNSDLAQGDTALHCAVEDEQLVRWLLDHGANPNLGRKNLWSSERKLSSKSCDVLNAVTARSTVRVLDLLLRHGALTEKLTLHFAVETELTEERKNMIKRLIELGVDVNGFDYELMGLRGTGTPLMWTAEASYLESARFLIAHGADPTIQCRYGGNPLKHAEYRFMNYAGRLTNGEWEDKCIMSQLARSWLLWRELYKASIHRASC